MNATAEKMPKTFRPQRYPAVQPVVCDGNEETRSLADKAGDLILKLIISGEIPAGARLKSTELSERLGMSRTPVTKAMAKLSSEGILAQPNNLQAIVAPVACDWLVQMHELRQLLEPEAASRAAGNIPQEHLEDLLVLSQDVKLPRGRLWDEAAKYFDFALHLTIADYSGNVPMSISIRRCWKYKALSYDLSDGCRSMLKSEYEQHLEILAAVVEGDSNLAGQKMAEHLQAASFTRYAPKVV